jgi:hypothetical protein
MGVRVFLGASLPRKLGISLFILFFQTLFLFSTPASAQQACLQLFRLKELPQVANDNEALQIIMENHIAAWNDLLGDLRAENVTLFLRPGPVSSSTFNGAERAINLGTLLNGTTATARDSVLAHEFGHAIFQQNFYITYEGERIYFRNLADAALKNAIELKNNDEFIELSRQAGQINYSMSLAKEANLPDKLAELEVYARHIQEKISGYEQPLAIFNHFHTLVIAYNELFADSLPVLIWSDAHRVAGAVDTSKDSFLTQLDAEMAYRGHNTDAPTSRDFAITKFKNWQHELGDAYTSLDPARGVLWTLYMENLPRSEIPLFLKTLLDATRIHVMERLAREEDIRPSNKDSDLTLINQEFIKIFKLAADRNGLPIRKSPGSSAQ